MVENLKAYFYKELEPEPVKKNRSRLKTDRLHNAAVMMFGGGQCVINHFTVFFFPSVAEPILINFGSGQTNWLLLLVKKCTVPYLRYKKLSGGVPTIF